MLIMTSLLNRWCVLELSLLVIMGQTGGSGKPTVTFFGVC